MKTIINKYNITIHAAIYGGIRAPNPKEQRKLKLEKPSTIAGEILCTKCKGTEVLLYCKKTRFNKNTCVVCSYCKGKGKLDWLDVILRSNQLNSTL